MAKIKNIPDLWSLDVIQVDDEGNKCVGGKIITKNGDIKDYPIHRKIIDSIEMIRDEIREKGFVEALTSRDIDTGDRKSPFSR